MTGKPKKLVYKCFKKIGKIGHFGKSGYSRSLYSVPILALFTTFAMEKH